MHANVFASPYLIKKWALLRFGYNNVEYYTCRGDGPLMILMPCTHTPKVFDLHSHNIQSSLPSLGDEEDLTLTPQQEIPDFLADHSGQVAL